MPEQDQMSSLIGLIYDAAADTDRWPAAVERVLDAVGATSGGLHFYSVTAAFHACVVPRTDPEWTRCFRERWVGRENLLQRFRCATVGQLWSFDTIVPRADLERSAFYNEFLQPQGEEIVLGANLLDGNTVGGTFSVFRDKSRGQFAGEEVKLLAAVVPHLRRAVQLHLRLLKLETGRTGLTTALDRLDQGALLVSADARVLLANRFAEEVLAKADGLRLEHGRLSACRGAETAQLRRLIAKRASVADGDSIALPRGGERPPLAAVVVSLPPSTEQSWMSPERSAAIVLLKDPERALPPPPVQQLAALFGLTPAQAAVALEVTYGEGGLRASAERLGIAYATARAHLAAVFGKTGARTQAELVRLLISRCIRLRND